MMISGRIKSILLFSLCLSAFSACSTQDEILEDIGQNEEAGRPHTCEMVFNVTRSGFDGAPQSRAASGWKEGDKIYLTFTTSGGSSYGDAVYKDGAWMVSYYGSLTSGVKTACSAVYFDNADSEVGSMVRLTENSGIYEDRSGSYVFNGGTLTVTAALKPKTGRIRFSGNAGEAITVSGISHFTSYDFSTGKFSTTADVIKTKVELGYTPYIYGEFTDRELPRLNLITSTSGFTRCPSTSIFRAGESGYMTIPTVSSHSGWLNSVVFKVNDVEFTMIPVERALGSFLMCETETTNALYNAVMGTTRANPQQPVAGLSSYYSSFMSKLSLLIGLTFDCPTAAEWYYAAKGGNRSKGYEYSGGNILSEVGWYEGNSGGELHDVKQLQPNELGFYDMSGNACEYANNEVYYLGGYYRSNEGACVVNTQFPNSSGSSAYCGLRFIMRLSNQ